MKTKRNPFARQELVPTRVYGIGLSCTWCGQAKHTPKNKRRYLWTVEVQSDGGSRSQVNGTFCSWDCFDSYHR